jgi:hypothetical protein
MGWYVLEVAFAQKERLVSMELRDSCPPRDSSWSTASSGPKRYGMQECQR